MALNSKIEWTDHTANFWWGCEKIAPGCKHCYADSLGSRYHPDAKHWGGEATGAVRKWIKGTAAMLRKLEREERIGKTMYDRIDAGYCPSTNELSLWLDANPANSPQKFSRIGKILESLEDRGLITGNKGNPGGWLIESDYRPPMVFVNDMSDLFEDFGGAVVDHTGKRLSRDDPYRWLTLDDLRREAFQLIDECPHLVFQVLTKRPENVRCMWLPETEHMPDSLPHDHLPHRDNVHLGVSISDQETADKNIPRLLKCRDLAGKLFVSYEPALGPVDFTRIKVGDCPRYNCLSGTFELIGYRPFGPAPPRIDQVIIGGESGPNARPCDLQWIRDAVRQCKAAGVACFVKQLGANASANDVIDAADYFPQPVRLSPGSRPGVARVHLKHPKGGDMNEWPDDLRVREFIT